MGEVERHTYSYRDVAESLVKKEGIHEGYWDLYIQFGLGAGGVPNPEGNEDSSPLLAAVVPVLKIGIQKAKEKSHSSVDAAKVNPRPRRRNAKAKLQKK